MAAVLTFWWMPDEEMDFLKFLTKHGVMAFSSGEASRALMGPFDLCNYVESQSPLNLWLALDSLVESVCINYYEFPSSTLPPVYRVEGMRSLVIGYQRGRFLDDARLSSSNLHAYWSYPDDAATTMIQKPEAFCKWARKVFAWVRRRTPGWHEYRRYRVSSTVKSAISAGQLRIVP